MPRFGWGLSIILFIATLIISNALGLPGIVSFIIALVVIAGIFGFFKFFSDIKKDNEKASALTKFKVEDYFKNEETKEWIKNDLIHQLYHEDPNFYVNEPNETISSEEALKRRNAGHIISRQRGFKTAYDKYINTKELTYYWQQVLLVMEEICNQNEDFKNDLKKITEKNSACLNMYAETIKYKGKVLKIDELEEYILDYQGWAGDNDLSKKNRISLKEKFDLEVNDLSEISNAIMELFVKRNKDFKETLIDFVDHYASSF